METKQTISTYEKIISNALVLFNSKGYDGTSISDIANASGVSKGIMYHYFKNKDALYLYCVQNFMDSSYNHINRQKTISEDIDELVAEIVNFGGFFEANPNYKYIFLNMINEKPTHLSPQLRKICEEFKERNRKHFAKLIETIDLGTGVSRYDVENFLFMVQSVGCVTPSTFASENKDENHLTILARMIKIYLLGLKATRQ